jgi:putative peptide zinc metalloprotease protein
MRKLTRIILLAAVLLTVAAAPTPALAADDAAVAVNLRDGAEIIRFSFHIRQTLNEVVDDSNAAVAYASCEDCRTIALSIQVILVLSDPDTVTPENLALAINEGCISCETLASAYQFVLGTGGHVRFTDEGRRRLAALRRELLELISSGLPIAELQAKIDELMDELREILENDLVAVDAQGTESQNATDTETTEDPALTGPTATSSGVTTSTETAPTETAPTESPTTETAPTETATTTDTGTTTTTP